MIFGIEDKPRAGMKLVSKRGKVMGSVMNVLPDHKLEILEEGTQFVYTSGLTWQEMLTAGAKFVFAKDLP